MCNDCSPDSSTSDLNRDVSQDFSQTPNEDTNQGTPGSDSDHPALDVNSQGPDESEAEEEAGLESRQGPLADPSQDIPKYLINLSKILAKGATAAEQQSYEQAGHDFGYLQHYNLAVQRAMLLTKIAFRNQWSFRLISDEERVTFIAAVLRDPSMRARESWTEKAADLMVQRDTLYLSLDRDRLIILISESRRRLKALGTLAILVILFVFLDVEKLIALWPFIKEALGL